MKLIKHITIALVLCAIPAMAFAQTVTCEDCTHAVSVYKGTGGLIATADDADMVTYVASCGGLTRHGELMADDDGVVSMLFTEERACAADGGSFELGPIMDGGWYWINDDDNSAVGNLVAKDILDNATTDLTGAGDGVTMMAGNGAVFVKETATGRVGILPNILPEPPTAALRKCGFDGAGTPGNPYSRRTSACAMGDGGTITLATTVDPFSGGTSQVTNGMSLVRPGSGGTATVPITVDLWGNHSGLFTTESVSTEPRGTPILGQPAAALSRSRGVARLQGVTYTVKVGAGRNAATVASGATAVAGISWSESTNAASITIAGDGTYCGRTVSDSVDVSVTAMMPAADTAQVTPSINRPLTGVVGGTSFTVVCGAATEAHQGEELVPDNPFPTDK